MQIFSTNQRMSEIVFDDSAEGLHAHIVALLKAVPGAVIIIETEDSIKTYRQVKDNFLDNYTPRENSVGGVRYYHNVDPENH